MNCSRCGKELHNKIFRINMVTYCEDCARELGLFDNMDPTKWFNNDTIFPQIFRELEFSPTKSQIICPKCKTSLRDYEKTGMLGCIECYNAFNETIMRNLMRNQANTQYGGRAPGVSADMKTPEGASRSYDVDHVSVSTTEPEEKVNTQVSGEKLAKYENSDIGMLSDDDLKEAIKLAVETENYLLAARFRDELKGREDK